MASFFSRGYSDNSTYCSSFGVAAGGGKCGVGIYCQKYGCWVDGSNFVSSHSRDYPSMINSKNTGPLIHYLRGSMISLALLVMV